MIEVRAVTRLPRRSALPAAIVLLAASAAVAQLRIPGPPTRRINDYAGALSAAERERLEQKLIEWERRTSS